MTKAFIIALIVASPVLAFMVWHATLVDKIIGI